MNSNAYGTFWMRGTVVGCPVFSLMCLKKASRRRWQLRLRQNSRSIRFILLWLPWYYRPVWPKVATLWICKFSL